MSFYADEFLSAKSGSFEKKEFNVGTDKSLETEVSESLNAFGIKGKVIGSESGPYITRVYFKLDRGVRFNSIQPLTEDLKMELRAPSIKIMTDPERGAVAIEIPNAKREIIPFGNVFHADHSDMVLPAALGVDPKGNPVYLDIADIPHMLIAGTTGSGKSVCLNSIITSLALNCRPTDLQFLLIDPKGTEFVQYENQKNLISGKIIDDVETALKSLMWLVDEMECRYKIFNRCKCRSIDEYKHKRDFGLNDRVSTCFVEDMPHVVVVIDEYADLMSKSANALQEDVKKLGNKARAAGIHLMLATQRPSAKIVEGDIKTNMSTRIALKMSSNTDSMTILDCGDAARLLGKGDMLLKRNDKEGLQRVHGCYTSEDVVKKAVELLPQKRLYRINEKDVFDNDVHELHAQEDLKKHATWGELNAVSKIILENFSEFMDREYDTIYQVCARRLGMDKSRVDIVFSDVNNAINDSEFYQILLRLCSARNEKCDCPFVKTVIYTSSLKMENGNEHELFIDYILEQAFEKDDSAAMAYMHFLGNVETSHLDCLKKKFDKLCEEGNEKAKKYLADLKDKVIDDLKNKYCDDIEEYPNRALFDLLLAEAYPPLLKFLLESRNTQYIIDAAGNNSGIEDFVVNQALIDDSWNDFVFDFEYWGNFKESCVRRMAEKGNDRAIECVCGWDDDSRSNSEREIIFQLAVQDRDVAIETVAAYSWRYDLRNRFSELSEYGQNKAIDALSLYVTRGSYEMDVVFDAAKKGNERACECIENNYDVFGNRVIEFIDNQNFVDVKNFAERINLLSRVDCHVAAYANFVCSMADEGNTYAKEMIYGERNCVGNYIFQQYIMGKADKADDDAWYCIRTHYDREGCSEFYDYVKSCAKNSCVEEKTRLLAKKLIFDYWYDYRDVVLELAYDGDESAKDAIYGALRSQETEFCDFVLNYAQNGNGKSQNAVYKNPQLFQQYILDEAQLGDDDAIDVVYGFSENNYLRELGACPDFILTRAKIGDNCAAKVIFQHPGVVVFQDFILEQAKMEVEDAKESVYSYPCIGKFNDFIFERAKEGDNHAVKSIFQHPNVAVFQSFILEQVKLGNEDATEVVYRHPEEMKFQEMILEYASAGDMRAHDIIFANCKIELFQKFICKLAACGKQNAKDIVCANLKQGLFQNVVVEYALNGNEEMKKIIYAYPEIEQFQRCLVKLASQGNRNAIDIIYENFLEKTFQEYIVAEARQNVERAMKCISENYKKSLFTSFLFAKSLEKSEWAITIICDDLKFFGSSINALNIKAFVDGILRKANTGDISAEKIIYKWFEVGEFQKYIFDKAQHDDMQAVGFIYDHSKECMTFYKNSLFKEFIKERIQEGRGCDLWYRGITVEYGLQGYELEGNIQGEGYQIFILAKALGGDEKSIELIKKYNYIFRSALSRCFKSNDEHTREFALDCKRKIGMFLE